MSDRLVFTAEQRQRALDARRRTGAARRQEHVAACAAAVDALKADNDPLPRWAAQMAQRARKGNVKALVGLKCADCCGFERDEIRHCPVASCPLHPLRPYKSSARQNAVVGVETGNEAQY